MKRLLALFAILLLVACSSLPNPGGGGDDGGDDTASFDLILEWPSGLEEMGLDIETKRWFTEPATFDFSIRGKAFVVTPEGERRIAIRTVSATYTGGSRKMKIPLSEVGKLRIAMYGSRPVGRMIFAWESVQEVAPGDTVRLEARILTGSVDLLSVDHRILRVVLAPGESRSFTVEAGISISDDRALILPRDQYELISIEVLSGPISISYPDATNPYLLIVTMAADAEPDAKGTLEMTVRGLGNSDITEVEEQLFTDIWFWVSSR